MAGYRLDDLIREINTVTFSPAVHGEGHRVVYSPKETRLYRKTLLGMLVGGRDVRHYFVKRFSVPKSVTDWKFHWSEGTSAVSLDFDASFTIEANEDIQAVALVKALGSSGNPGEKLYGLISGHLNTELSHLLQVSNTNRQSLTDLFHRSDTGIGEYQKLNEEVSERVAAAIGCRFRIGFKLVSTAPEQVTVSRSDDFTLSDSETSRKARTTALLKLENYQAYKKSGLEGETAIRGAIEAIITDSVRDLLFGRKYYEVVESFKDPERSVESQMRARIAAAARRIGYKVSMFQTFPDIAALDLLEWDRIDIAPDQHKYSLKDSTNDVQIDLALSVKVAPGGYQKLHLLIEPDHTAVAEPVRRRVFRICEDALKAFDWQEFNLKFEAVIEPVLRTKIAAGLSRCGLDTEVERIAPRPTEDASRFKALRGRTTRFEVSLSSQANVGRAERVTLQGRVEVTSLAMKGWGSFEAKDFGYRADSRLNETRLRALASERSVAVPEVSPLPAEERHSLAIELELLEIRDRVADTLREAMTKVPDLAANWRTLESSQQIIQWAEGLATQAIEKEFGLTVALRSVFRHDTGTEKLAQLEQDKAVELGSTLLDRDVARETALRQVADQHEVNLLNNAGGRELQLLEVDDSPEGAKVREAAAARLRSGQSAERLTAESIADKLKQPQAQVAPSPKLPWLAGKESDGGEPKGGSSDDRPGV